MATSFAQKNAQHFNHLELQGWPQWVLDLHQQIYSFLRSPQCPDWLNLNDNGNRRMLDYACGSGIVTQALKPHFTSAIGIDVSSKMVGMYNAAAERLGLTPDVMLGAVGDLTAKTILPTDPIIAADRLINFNLVVVCMALHHFDDPLSGITRLTGRLKPGGTLLVIDWTPMNGTTCAQRAYAQERREKDDGLIVPDEHTARHTVSKPDGFSETEMREIFEHCGCVDMKWKLADDLSDVPPAKKKLQLFWACATRMVEGNDAL